MDDDDLLGGPDDDDILGSSDHNRAHEVGIDLLEEVEIQENSVPSTPTRTSSQRMLADEATQAMKLDEENKVLAKKIEQFKSLLVNMNHQVESLKTSTPGNNPKALQAERLKLIGEMESLPPLIAKMKSVGEMAVQKIASLDAELNKLRAERAAELDKNRSDRVNADVMKYAQAMNLQKNAFKREMDVMTMQAETLEAYLAKTTPLSNKIPSYCIEADSIISDQTNLFYEQRDLKNALKKDSTALEEQIAELNKSIKTVTEDLKVKRREVLKLTLEMKEKATKMGTSGAAQSDFDDMLGGDDDGDDLIGGSAPSAPPAAPEPAAVKSQPEPKVEDDDDLI